jgi:hypothetical protein
VGSIKNDTTLIIEIIKTVFYPIKKSQEPQIANDMKATQIHGSQEKEGKTRSRS